jgi:hypothetical protein
MNAPFRNTSHVGQPPTAVHAFLLIFSYKKCVCVTINWNGCGRMRSSTPCKLLGTHKNMRTQWNWMQRAALQTMAARTVTFHPTERLCGNANRRPALYFPNCTHCNCLVYSHVAFHFLNKNFFFAIQGLYTDPSAVFQCYLHFVFLLTCKRYLSRSQKCRWRLGSTQPRRQLVPRAPPSRGGGGVTRLGREVNH